MNPDPLTVPEEEERAAFKRREYEHVRGILGAPPRLTVDAGWLLVVAILAAVVGVIIGRLTG